MRYWAEGACVGAGIMPQLSCLRDLALRLAGIADEIALRHFGEPVPAVAKPDGSPVTAADHEIEQALRDEISATDPAHTVLGEEQGGEIAGQASRGSSTPSTARIPSTAQNFMRGIPVFATLIAATVDGEVTAGVASAPALGERWDAARGLGTRRNGVEVGVSAISELADAHVLHGGLDPFAASQERWQRLGEIARAAWRTRGFGEFWMHLLVAGGMAEVAMEDDLSIWDVAAIEIIVNEAGGRMTRWDGTSVLLGGAAVSTNGLLHEEICAGLNADGRAPTAALV